MDYWTLESRSNPGLNRAGVGKEERTLEGEVQLPLAARQYLNSLDRVPPDMLFSRGTQQEES